MIPKDISTKIGKAVSDRLKVLSQFEAFEEARKKEQEAAPVAPVVPEKAVAEVEDTLVEGSPIEMPKPAMSDDRERRLAQVAAAAEGAKYRAALQAPDPLKGHLHAAQRMKETGEVRDVVGVEDPGFAERYDEDVRFQEEEYGEGSLERERALSEILGVGWRTKRASPRREDLIEKGRYAFDDLYEEAKAANPEGREEDWQDAAIKAYHRSKAEDASEFARTFEVEDTAQVSGKMEDYAAKRAAELREARLKREAEAAKKQGDVVSKAVNRVQGKAPTQPVATPQDAARKAFRKGLMDETAARREAQKAEAEKYFEEQKREALRSTTPLGQALSLQKRDPESFRRAQSVPGMEDLIPAVSALDAGNLSGFNRTFGKREAPTLLDYTLRKQDYRPEGIASLPEDLRRSLGSQLSKTLDAEKTKAVSDIEGRIKIELERRANAPYVAAGAQMPPEQGAILEDKAREIAELIVGTSDIAGSPRFAGQEGWELPFLGTEFGRLDPELRRPLEGAGIVTPQTPNSQVQAVLRSLIDKIPEAQRQSILDLREGERTLSMLGDVDTTPPIQEESPVEDLIADAIEEQGG